LPSNGRVSSGESKFLTSMLAISVLLRLGAATITGANRSALCSVLNGGKEVRMTLRTWLPRLLLLGMLALVVLGTVACGGGSNY
jgi:hypothetical protein